MTVTTSPAVAARATVIGDLVGSRKATDRAILHARLKAALRRTNAVIPAATPLAVTVGDEFQGSYARLGNALDATVRVYLDLMPEYEVRFGIGWGEVTTLDGEGIQDGPGWWSARDAIVRVHARQARASTRALTTEFEATPDQLDPSTVDLVTASLLLRDQALASLSEVSKVILGRLMDN
ncbi:MAG: SatD family protein, partial [Nostocoides sp.]